MAIILPLVHELILRVGGVVSDLDLKLDMVVSKSIRTGFFWKEIFRDAAQICGDINDVENPGYMDG